MEDNYYKKGKDKPKVQSTDQKQTSEKASKSRTKTQLARQNLKNNYHELGKGRIVESSQSGFAIQQPTHQQTASEGWNLDCKQPIIELTHEVDKTVRGQAPLLGQDMSANSNNQRRNGRHSHDHFATLHQTPQPVIQVGNSGTSTPLTHLIQRRQFEMTQLPKSNSAVSVHAAESYNQQQVLSIHLQNPKITSYTGTKNSSKKMATTHNLLGDIQLDKNISTLSGGQLNSHLHRVSNQSSKPVIKKPQGGVFQSGPDKPHTIKNNFMVQDPASVTESPQFILHQHQKFKFFSQMEASTKSGEHTADKMKNALGQERQSAGQLKKIFSNTAGVTALSLQQQNSSGGLAMTTASQFNTPSNCYQAPQQQQLPGTSSSDGLFVSRDLVLQHKHSNLNGSDPILLTENVHQLSQNSYEITAPLHVSTSHTPANGNHFHGVNASLIGNSVHQQNLHLHSNSTVITNLASQVQNISAQNLPAHQSITNNHSQVNFTQHTQQAHPNLQAAVHLHHHTNQRNALNPNQGHLSASQFDISALLRQQPNTTAHQPVFDFQELCSNTTHHAGHQTQVALKMSVDDSTRDIDFLRQRFYAEYGCDTNDILTLYSYWQQNFQSFVQPATNNGNQSAAINALNIANMSSYRQNPQHHNTITGPTGKFSNNVTAFGSKSRHTTVNQHQTINFNSQSFENQTMTTSQIQPRKIAKMLDIAGAPFTATHVKEGAPLGTHQDSTEIQHFQGAGYTPFDVNQQMFFIAKNPSQQLIELKGRRTQPCIRQNSTVSNRQNCTDTVSFHRDVPTPMMQREALVSVEAEDERNEFSFEEPAMDGTNEHSIEEEEKSLINALSFKKQIAPLADRQNLHEIENQRGWATTKQETTESLPKYRNASRPLSKDQCGFTIQLSPINRFAPSPRSKKSVFEFYGLKNTSKSLLHQGITQAKSRIRKKGSINKDGARKFLHRHFHQQQKTLEVLTRGQSQDICPVFKLKTALEMIFVKGGHILASQEHFKRLIPKKKDFDSNDNKTTGTYRGDERSDGKRRREKSMKGRGTSKSRKRQGSRNSRKQRMASLYRDSTSSIGEDSASIPMFTHMSKDVNRGEFMNVMRHGSQVVEDAETTQDIQKLCKEIEEAEKNFADKLNQDEDQFDQQVTRHVSRAERALQDSKRESQTRELSLRGTGRESHPSIVERSNFKAQSLSSLNQAMQLPVNLTNANATQRHLNPSEMYGTKENIKAKYTKTNDPIAPNTERPNAQSIEMRLALHHNTQQQQQKVSAEDDSNHDADTTKPMFKAQQPKTQSKGNRINVVSLLDQKSEPCLLKPKKLAFDRNQIKILSANSKTQSAQKELENQNTEPSRTLNDRKMGTQITVQSSSSVNSKRKLTFIKTKNINFHSLSKISGRVQNSATSTNQAAPSLRIKLQKTANGEQTERSGQEMRFAAQTTCQSALATHKHAGKDLARHGAHQMSTEDNNTLHLRNGHHQTGEQQSENSGATPDKPSGKIKYASARIKLLRVDTSEEKNLQPNQNKQKTLKEEKAEKLSNTSSATSTIAGYRGMRRLVEMCINEYYRKRGKSIKTVPRDKQVDILVEFWWQSLSQQKILGKLKGKLAKTGLVEKEKYLMNFLNGKDRQSLFNLHKHSTTRKYGELAIVDEQVLRQALKEYLTQSQ